MSFVICKEEEFHQSFTFSRFPQVLHQYINYVKPAFEEFCMPTKKFADVIIPRGPENK